MIHSEVSWTGVVQVPQNVRNVGAGEQTLGGPAAKVYPTRFFHSVACNQKAEQLSLSRRASAVANVGALSGGGGADVQLPRVFLFP